MVGISDYLDSRYTSYKKRFDANYALFSESARDLGGNPYYGYSSGFTADGWGQETCSVNHPDWKYRKGKAGDVGGPFYSRKVTFIDDPRSWVLSDNVSGPPKGFWMRGKIYPNLDIQKMARSFYDRDFHNRDQWTSANAFPRASLRAEGLKLMLKAVPTTPAWSAAAALGELREGLFKTPLGSLARDADPGGEFLNYQFGILPTISDWQAYVEACDNSEKIISQLIANRGKQVRRRRSRPVSYDRTVTDLATLPVAGNGVGLNAYICRNSRLLTTKKIRRKIWFSGAFEQYVPANADAFWKKLQEVNAVYGVIPNPGTIWQLTPFSWLTDWFTNSDELIRQLFLAGTDGSVLVRGYVMCRSHIETTYELTTELNFSGTWKPVRLKYFLVEDILQRERSRAYAMDFEGVNLSATQLAILASLGISKRG